jgi:quinolinate synthase
MRAPLELVSIGDALELNEKADSSGEDALGMTGLKFGAESGDAKGRTSSGDWHR